MFLGKRLKNDGNLVKNVRIPVNEDIYLGGYHQGDKAMLVTYLNDLTIYKNTLNIPHPYTAKDADWWIDHITKEQEKLNLQPNWTIRHVEHGLIGGIGMVVQGDQIDNQQEIGYWLAKPFRQKGIMTATIKSLCSHCFERHNNLLSISAHIFPENKASRATIKKAGFTLTRIIDDYYTKGDRSISAYEYILNKPLSNQ